MLFNMNVSDDRDGFAELRRLVKDIRVAMLTTFNAEGEPHTRPMYTQVIGEERTIRFLTSTDSAKAEELARDPRTIVTYADSGADNYVVVNGSARVVRDPDLVRRMWSVHAKAWFPEGPDDPSIGVLEVTPERGEYWDGPSKVAYTLSVLRALVTGGTPDGGEHRVVQDSTTTPRAPRTGRAGREQAMPRSDGKSRAAEMRRNDTNRNPAGTGAKRFQSKDAAGDSSSRSRTTKSGAEHAQSASAGRRSGGGPTGTSSRGADRPTTRGRGR